MTDRAKLEAAVRNATRAPRIPGLGGCPFPTVTLDARDVDALRAAAEAHLATLRGETGNGRQDDQL